MDAVGADIETGSETPKPATKAVHRLMQPAIVTPSGQQGQAGSLSPICSMQWLVAT